jgi:DNA-3-methyladenine glycosylase I
LKKRLLCATIPENRLFVSVTCKVKPKYRCKDTCNFPSAEGDAEYMKDKYDCDDDYPTGPIEWSDGKPRCLWANPKNERYIRYHDEEWGVPVHDDKKLFEMLILECFQAGLSWECVLNKRDAFRKAFDGFDSEKICGYDSDKLEKLRNNPDIIRNRLKIQAAVKNARIFREIAREYGSFSNYLWQFTDGKIICENTRTSSPLSDEISKDLKKRGMKFVGTTVIYAYLQAVGVINSHMDGCFLKEKTTI